MANRNGQVTPMPTLQKGSSVTAEIPRIQFAQTSDRGQSGGEALFSLSQTLKGISTRFEDRLDMQAQIEGRDAGYVAGENGVPQRADDMTIRGRAFNAAAADSMALQFELKSREALASYEDKAGANPAEFKKLSDAYITGAAAELRGFDIGLSQRFAGDYQIRAGNALERVKSKHEAIVRDRQLETSLRLQMALSDDIAAQAGRLFEVPADQTMAVMTQMIGSAGKLVDAVNQVGPDGRPIFGAAQRIAAEREAEQMVAQGVGMAWMRQQPDMLAAYDAWRKGEAFIEVADETGARAKISLHDMLGESGYRHAEDAFFDSLKSDLAMRAQVDAARDRAFADNSDELFTDLSVLAQSGSLTLPIVEASRAQLEPDRYLSLRALAKGNAPSVSDGHVVARLTTDIVAGKDVQKELLLEFEGNRLSQSDYISLLDRNAQRANKGVQDPVSVGRDYVGNSLGKLATELGFAQSLSIPQAEGEYAVRIDQFVKQNERQPTTTEALKISQDVVRRYSVMDTGASIANMPLPMMMAPAQKLSGDLSRATIQDVSQQTRDYFLRQYNGNESAMENDPRYQEEMQLLLEYSDLIQIRDANAPRPDPAK